MGREVTVVSGTHANAPLATGDTSDRRDQPQADLAPRLPLSVGLGHEAAGQRGLLFPCGGWDFIPRGHGREGWRRRVGTTGRLTSSTRLVSLRGGDMRISDTGLTKRKLERGHSPARPSIQRTREDIIRPREVRRWPHAPIPIRPGSNTGRPAAPAAAACHPLG